jgi:hypothetical protein
MRLDLTLLRRALLTAESAIAHIYHFCDVLPRSPYVDLRPVFIFVEYAKTDLINGTIVLPSCLNSLVRHTSGLGWWETEHAAKKETALQAYVALYRAGLLNENLLPFHSRADGAGRCSRGTSFNDRHSSSV